jgi:hypothetical protein
MKKVSNYRILAVFAVAIIALVGIVFPEYGAEAISFLGLGGAAAGGTVFALFTGPATIANAETLSPDHLTRFVSKMVVERKASDLPLDTILRNIRKAENTNSHKVEYEEVTYRPFTDTIGTGTAGGSNSEDLVMTNGSMWAVDDIIRVPSLTGNDSNELNLLVTAVSGNTVTVTAINAASQTVPAIGTVAVYRGGNAKTELDAQTTVKYALPTNLYNFCQYQSQQLEHSTHEARRRAYSGYSYKDKADQAIFDFKSKCEAQHMFGVRGESTVGTDKHYTAAGAYNTISNAKTFGTGSGAVDPSLNDILELAETAFAGNAGSKEKVMFAGKQVITGLSKIDKYNRDISFNQSEIYHGVDVKKLCSTFGDIRVVHSRTMDVQGKSDEAMVLDMEYFLKHDFVPLTATTLELKKSGTRNVQDAIFWEETSCTTLRYAGSEGVHVLWQPAA